MLMARFIRYGRTFQSFTVVEFMDDLAKINYIHGNPVSRSRQKGEGLSPGPAFGRFIRRAMSRYR